jgi:predicted transcriptional regulator
MSLKDYESESSAIRRIQLGEIKKINQDTKWGDLDPTLKKLDTKSNTMQFKNKAGIIKTVDKNDRFFATKVDALKSDGYVRVYEDTAKVVEEIEKSINITEEEIKISPKLLVLLRMGLVEKGELETMKRALKKGEDSMKNPTLRKQIFELFNKLVEAVTDDQQIWVRMRKRLTKKEKGEEE